MQSNLQRRLEQGNTTIVTISFSCGAYPLYSTTTGLHKGHNVLGVGSTTNYPVFPPVRSAWYCKPGGPIARTGYLPPPHMAPRRRDRSKVARYPG